MGDQNGKTTTTTRLTTTTTEMQKIVSESLTPKPSAAQKPKILMSESTMKTLEKNEDSDVMTDDDTDSVGSSVDSDFIHRALVENGDNENADSHGIEPVDSQFQRLSISMSAADTRPTMSKDFQNLSHQFDQMGIDEGRKPAVGNCSIVTLSSTDEVLADQDTMSALSESHINDVIILTDSDVEERSASARLLLNTGEPQVSDNQASSLKLPCSSLMEKINDFFDNVPSLEPERSLSTTISPAKISNEVSHKDSIYISETSHEEIDSDTEQTGQKRTKASNGVVDSESVIAASVDNEASVRQTASAAETNNDIKIDIPVSKSSSDQPRQLVKSQSGIKLTTTRSTPIIESTVRKPSSNVSAVVKKTGSKIKLLTDSNGQVNISAKININIHINQLNVSTSEDSSSAHSDEPPKDSPAIELNIQSAASPATPPNEPASGAGREPEQREEAGDKSPSVFKTKLRVDVEENAMRTPADKLSKFHFSAPKSMTKSSKKQLYKTPKRSKTPRKENMPDGFVVDSNIPIDAKDQILLHQVYGDAWKTPDVLKCYSAVKGKPQLREQSRLVQSANCANKVANSRISSGFICCKFSISGSRETRRIEKFYTQISYSISS